MVCTEGEREREKEREKEKEREREEERERERDRLTHLPKKVDRDIFYFLKFTIHQQQHSERGETAMQREHTVNALLSTRAVPQVS